MPPAGGWTAGRVISLLLGLVLALISLGLLGGGGTLLWAGQALRQDGYVTTGTATYSTTGHAGQVSAYVSGTAYATVTGPGPGHLVTHGGTVTPAPPRTARIWVAQAAGTGTQTLRWTAERGNWMAVTMNPGGSAGLSVRADAGVSAPWLVRLAVELIIGGILAGALAAALIMVPVRLASGAR